MYLIDDRLYKDNILNSQNTQMTLNNTISQSQFTNGKYLSADSNPGYFPPPGPNPQMQAEYTKPNHENDQKPEEKQQLAKKDLIGKSPTSLSTITNSGLSKETQTDDEPNKNTIYSNEMETESSLSNAECHCSGTTKGPPEQLQLTKKTKTNPRKKEKISDMELRALGKSAQPEENDASSDGELRKRLHKLRYDYDDSQDQNYDLGSSQSISPPQPPSQSETTHSKSSNKKTTSKVFFFCSYCSKRFDTNVALENHMFKTHQKKIPNGVNNPPPPIEGSKDKISFICTICSSRFKRFHSLSRHMKNIHPDYFGEWVKKNKRAHEGPEAGNNKKAKWDGRMKRKLKSDDEIGDKKMRRDFKCFFCSQHFKTEVSLERHERTIHAPSDRVEKRKVKDSEPAEGTYAKRSKGDPKKAIQYSDYF